MTTVDIANQRLHNQHLLKNLRSPEEVVRWLGAVQSQDFIGAKWAIGLRCNTTDAAVQKAFDDGKFLRTHALRPTWHFVAAEDIVWIQELTGPRVHQQNKYYYKKLGIDEVTIKKAKRVLGEVLKGGNHLPKIEIAKHFTKAGIEELRGLRFSYLLMISELDGLICSGAMQGKQQTYALIADRAPNAKKLSHDDALAELTRRFFTAHGPAQIADFAWWSSLTIADIKHGIELVNPKTVEIDGKTYYFMEESPKTIPSSPIAHLLPNYDEYFIAYKDRSAFSNFKMSLAPSYADLSYHLLAIDGELAGGWKRDITTKEFTVKLKQFNDFSTAQQKSLNTAIKNLSHFMNLPVKLTEQ